MRSRQATSKQVSPVSPPPSPLPKSNAKGKKHKEKGQQHSLKKIKITPESKMGSGTAKRKKTAERVEEVKSPSFHSSQTQGVESVLPSFSRRSPGGPLGPLSGYSEFICCVHLFLDSR